MQKDETGKISGYTRMVDGKEFPKAIKLINIDTTHLESHLYTDIAYYLFENKKYKKALQYFNRGVEVYPNDLNMKMNLAHVHLFNNEYSKAIDIYKNHLHQNVYPTVTWEQLLQSDLMYFKEHHYINTSFDRVFKELNIKKPRGY